MTIAEIGCPMTAEEIVSLTKRHTIFSWSAPAERESDPDGAAKGIYFWDANGKRYMCSLS